MREPHVRWCESWGRATSPGYSIPELPGAIHPGVDLPLAPAIDFPDGASADVATSPSADVDARGTGVCRGRGGLLAGAARGPALGRRGACHAAGTAQSWAGLGRIWTELRATQQYYPVLHSAFWVEHRLWGDATLGYHLLNVLLHATAAAACCGGCGGCRAGLATAQAMRARRRGWRPCFSPCIRCAWNRWRGSRSRRTRSRWCSICWPAWRTCDSTAAGAPVGTPAHWRCSLLALGTQDGDGDAAGRAAGGVLVAAGAAVVAAGRACRCCRGLAAGAARGCSPPGWNAR